jgi:uncharacterized membrane protein
MAQPQPQPQILNRSSAGVNHRVPSIDVLRGLVIVLMILDHTRDFLGAGGINPRDVTLPALFLTRWITHFCAPVFVFLSGVSAWFYLSQKHSLLLARRYLLLRGLWLIVLEITLVRFGWSFDWRLNFLILQVIWVLGWGMILLSLLIGLPRRWIGFLGIAMVAGHNLLDVIQAEQISSPGLAMLWHIFHQPGTLQLFPGVRALVVYPLIPWTGVMAIGFAMAPDFKPTVRKPRFFIILGSVLISLFILLRWTSFYGDPQPWRPASSWLVGLLSFINCEKYPPSLQFLLMTLGPTFLLYPLIKLIPVWLANVLQVFGRVPLFVYVIHLPLLHSAALLQAMVMGPSHDWLVGGFPLFAKPDHYGLQLLEIYFAFFVALLILYPICQAYGHQKIVAKKLWHWFF